jgi:hypothetical protein
MGACCPGGVFWDVGIFLGSLDTADLPPRRWDRGCLSSHRRRSLRWAASRCRVGVERSAGPLGLAAAASGSGAVLTWSHHRTTPVRYAIGAVTLSTVDAVIVTPDASTQYDSRAIWHLLLQVWASLPARSGSPSAVCCGDQRTAGRCSMMAHAASQTWRRNVDAVATRGDLVSGRNRRRWSRQCRRSDHRQ